MGRPAIDRFHVRASVPMAHLLHKLLLLGTRFAHLRVVQCLELCLRLVSTGLILADSQDVEPAQGIGSLGLSCSRPIVLTLLSQYYFLVRWNRRESCSSYLCLGLLG